MVLYRTSYKDSFGLSTPLQNSDNQTFNVSCGVDQNSNSWVKINNQYYYSSSDLFNYANGSSTFGVLLNAIAQGEAQYKADVTNTPSYSTKANLFIGVPPQAPLSYTVGVLKSQGIDFYAYVPPPPPAPLPPPPIQSPTIRPGNPGSGGQTVTISAPPPGTILSNFSSGYHFTTSDFVLSSYEKPVTFVFGEIGTDHTHYLLIIITSSNTYFFDWVANTDYTWNPHPEYASANPLTLKLIDIDLTSPTLTIPPGYVTLPASWQPRNNAWPLYGANPTFDSNGIASFAGAKGFYSLALTMGPTGPVNSLGLDPQKLQTGIYAYLEKDLGAITLGNGRIYELFSVNVWDTFLNKDAGTFYETTEGGGGGVLIKDPLGLVARLITDVSTLGSAEAYRYAAQKSGVPDSTINLATEAFAAAAVVVATAGTIIVASAPAAGAAGALVDVAAPTVGETVIATGPYAGLTASEVAAGGGSALLAAGGGGVVAATTGTTLLGKVGGLVASEVLKLSTVLGTGLASKAIQKALNPSTSQPPVVPPSLTINSTPATPSTPWGTIGKWVAAGGALALLVNNKRKG